MSVFTFSTTSPVQEITFHHANDRPPVALLATDGITHKEQLPLISQALVSAGWDCVPVSVDGREVLQVSGFEQEQQLLNFMRVNHYSEGEPKYTLEAGDHPTRTASEWLQHSSLKTAGWLNLVGDAALLVSGIMNKDSKEVTAGLLYTAGAGVLARYGNVKTEHHVRQVSEKTAEFLKKQAVELPENCGLSHIMEQKREGLISGAENFLYRYPSEVMLGAYTLGATAMLQSGLKRGNAWGVAYGANSVGLKAASLFIHEKHKTDEEKAASANQGPMGKFVDWVQEKPLRLFGFGSMVSDTLLGLSALKDYSKNPTQKGYIFKFITTGTYILADLMMAISSKNHANAGGKFDDDEQRQIIAMAAEAISRQPLPVQAALVQNVAAFMTTQTEICGSVTDIAKSIHEQLSQMNSNPWTYRTETNTVVPPVTSNR